MINTRETGSLLELQNQRRQQGRKAKRRKNTRRRRKLSQPLYEEEDIESAKIEALDHHASCSSLAAELAEQRQEEMMGKQKPVKTPTEHDLMGRGLYYKRLGYHPSLGQNSPPFASNPHDN